MKHRITQILLAVIWATMGIQSVVCADLLYEGFDVSTGTLNNKAGATSYGFDPVLGTVWNSGLFGAPNVGPGSIDAPASTSSYYNATPTGNRVVQDFQSTVIGRATQVSGTHLYGTYLATMGLNGAFITWSQVNFDNFQIIAENPGSNATTATWKVQTSGGTVDTGANAQGTTLVSWELEFDQSSWANPDTLRVWFNKNPLTDAPDYFNSSSNLGQNVLGGLHMNNSIFLGLSTVEYDEFRVGSSWQGAGIANVPEPGSIAALVVLSLSFTRRRQRSKFAATC